MQNKKKSKIQKFHNSKARKFLKFKNQINSINLHISNIRKSLRSMRTKIVSEVFPELGKISSKPHVETSAVKVVPRDSNILRIASDVNDL